MDLEAKKKNVLPSDAHLLLPISGIFECYFKWQKGGSLLMFEVKDIDLGGYPQLSTCILIRGRQRGILHSDT